MSMQCLVISIKFKCLSVYLFVFVALVCIDFHVTFLLTDPLPDLALLRQEICQYYFWLLLGYVY